MGGNYCGDCGGRLVDGKTFCPHCGSPSPTIEGGTGATPAAPPPPPPAPVPDRAEAGGSRAVLWVLAIIVFCVAAGIGGYTYGVEVTQLEAAQLLDVAYDEGYEEGMSSRDGDVMDAYDRGAASVQKGVAVNDGFAGRATASNEWYFVRFGNNTSDAGGKMPLTITAISDSPIAERRLPEFGYTYWE